MASYKILVLVFFSALACTAAVRELSRNNAADVHQQDSSDTNAPAGGGIGGSIDAGGQGSADGRFGLGGPGGSLGLGGSYGGATSGGLGGSFGFGPIDGGGLLPRAGASGQVGGGAAGSIGLGPFGGGLGGDSGGANP